MAPLPQSNTPRYRIVYNTGENEHTLQIRHAATVSTTLAGQQIADFLTQIEPLLGEITIVRAEAAAAGSNVFVPAFWPGDPTYGSGDPGAINEPAFISFVGRSTGGRRIRVFVFGISAVTQADYRLSEGESAVVAAALGSLESGPDFWQAIDGLQPVWNRYANMGFNAHYQRKARG